MSKAPRYPVGTQSAYVIGVSSGCSVDIRIPGGGVKLALKGVECPLGREADERAARRFTTRAVFDRAVRIRLAGINQDGVSEADVYYEGTVLLNRELVANGLARARDPLLRDAESEARRLGRGIWAPR
ncbi:MAG: thermonuclease family protein [Gammaproteobacteria bacterium]